MEQVGIARRDFLKGIAAAALTAGVIGTGEARALANMDGNIKTPNILPQVLQPFPTIKGPRGEKFWDLVRKTFVLPDNYIHMNTGTTGSQPLFSLVNLGVYNLYKSMDPKDWETNLAHDFPDLVSVSPTILGSLSIASRQAAVAGQYGANADEIVLSYNTTDACNLIFAGTPWEKGDRIVCTQWEHNALIGPIAWARDNLGVDVVIVDLPSNFTSGYTIQDVLDFFEPALQNPPTGKKQYLATSEIFYKNGLRLPVKELCALARSYGAYSIIDTAHGWGMLPIDCHDYGADFICGAGHKWLCGGPGTGIFYIRTSYLGPNPSSSPWPRPPFNMGNFFLYGFDLFSAPSPNYQTRDWVFPPSVSVQFRGEANTPALYAMTDSAAYFGSIGVKDIYNRGVSLGTYLKTKIANQWGLEALWVNPGNASFATALTSLNPFQERNDPNKYAKMNAAMSSVLKTLAGEDPKIYLRTTTWHDLQTDPADNRVGIRISTHGVYNNCDQIDHMFGRLVKALEAAATANQLHLL